MVAAGVLPISHATGWRWFDPHSCRVNGLIGLKVSRGVYSLAPALSDLSGLVSIQGCVSRSVRDTAAFVDNCRGGAPGEFMPFWSPAEPYSDLIKRDPGKLRIALSHEWGDYKAPPHFVAELERVGKMLEGLGHHVEWALPEVDFRNAFAAQTTCYISNFAQVIAGHLARLGLDKPTSRSAGADQYQDLGERAEHVLYRAQRDAGRVQYDVARLSARSSSATTSS